MCVWVCVFVNNSHLFIGLKLYTMKASLRQDVLFGCQKKKLKKKNPTKKGGRDFEISFFSSFSLPIFLWLMTTINFVFWSQMPKRWREDCWRSFSRKKGFHDFLRMNQPSNGIIFQLNWIGGWTASFPVFIFQRMRLKPRGLSCPRLPSELVTEVSLVHSNTLFTKVPTKPSLLFSTPVRCTHIWNKKV